MKCLECGCTRFEISNVRFTPTIKDQPLEVVIPCHVCLECHSPFMDSEQVNIMRRVASDLYRKNQNLLTSEQIIQYRNNLGFSQVSFANYLKVGEASIRRWESHSIQDHGQDDHIRTKCDLEEAEKNYYFIAAKTEMPDFYNGNRRFSPQVFDQISAYFLYSFPIGCNVLNKLLFYADFLHFYRSNQSITGIKYVAMRNGPTPCKLSMFAKETIELKRPDAFQPNFIDRKEIDTLKFVAEYYNSMEENEFCSRSKKERGYLSLSSVAK